MNTYKADEVQKKYESVYSPKGPHEDIKNLMFSFGKSLCWSIHCEALNSHLHWQYYNHMQKLNDNTDKTNSSWKPIQHQQQWKKCTPYSILWSLLSLPKIGEMKLKVVKSSTSNSDKLWGLSIGYMKTQPHYQPAMLNNRALCETAVRYTKKFMHDIG